jgi:isoamylase
VLALTLAGFNGERDLHVILNMFDQTLRFELPEIPNCNWARVIDTGLPSPDDIVEPGSEVVVDDIAYQATGRSVVVLVSQDRAER